MQNLQISNNRSLWHLAKCLKKSAKSIHSVLDCPPFGAPVSDCRPWVALLLEANVMTLPGWSLGKAMFRKMSWWANRWSSWSIPGLGLMHLHWWLQLFSRLTPRDISHTNSLKKIDVWFRGNHRWNLRNTWYGQNVMARFLISTDLNTTCSWRCFRIYLVLLTYFRR